MVGTTPWKYGDTFPVLDLLAWFEFKTSSSLSLGLGTTVDRRSPRPPEMEEGELTDFLLQRAPRSLS